jgi:hypothetical protein
MYRETPFNHHKKPSAMRNTIFTSVIISAMILSAGNVSATGNESRKTRKDCGKRDKELLKFSVNDFVGTEDSGADEIISFESPKPETPEKDAAKPELSGEEKRN